MQTLRSLRLNRSLTLIDLSALTGIPARTLAEIEYGLRLLGGDERERLALALGTPPSGFTGTHQSISTATARSQPAPSFPGSQFLVATALLATLATAAVQSNLLEHNLAALSVPARVREPGTPAPASGNALTTLATDAISDDAAALWQATLAELAQRAVSEPEAVSPNLVLTPTPRLKSESVAQAAPKFVLSDAGPIGCPVQPTSGRVVLTQGYGEGSHTPAEIWGAIDLAVDGNGDGIAEPETSWYVPIVATHDGVVQVDLDSYPAGNHVWVNSQSSTWRSGYSHLAIVTVISGQFVRAGEVIGMMGSTGETSGPHLDYQVWNGETNVDPTGLVGCA